jgi:hypothetical protein
MNGQYTRVVLTKVEKKNLTSILDDFDLSKFAPSICIVHVIRCVKKVRKNGRPGCSTLKNPRPKLGLAE